MIYSTDYRSPSFYPQPSHYSHWNTIPVANNAESARFLQARHSEYVYPSQESLIRRPFRTMAQMTPAELEEFQNLSDRYQADLPGTLIGEKLPMDVLVTEYAQADPTFVVKTTGLAATHSAYRAIKGDGQCGWRATVFSYFELLLRSDDPSLVQIEKIRFETFAETMTQIGMDYELLADMFDYTWQLFDTIIEAVQNNVPDDNIILNILNDENPSNSVVYHFKMVTSAYMQLHEDNYAPFLEIPVDQYRVTHIDPTNQEIDQIGLQALTDAVISPAGFALEVLYLDRSMGEEVTPHSFSQGGEGIPTIQLLYRPGHYDIIYKDTRPLQVYLQPQQTSMTRMEDPHEFSSGHDFLFPQAPLPTPQIPGTYDATFQPSGQYLQHNTYDTYFQPQAPMYNDMAWYPPPTHQSISPHVSKPVESPTQPHYQPSASRSISSRSVTMSPSPPSAHSVTNEPQIRFSSSMFNHNMQHYQTAPLGQYSGR